MSGYNPIKVRLGSSLKIRPELMTINTHQIVKINAYDYRKLVGTDQIEDKYSEDDSWGILEIYLAEQGVCFFHGSEETFAKIIRGEHDGSKGRGVKESGDQGRDIAGGAGHSEDKPSVRAGVSTGSAKAVLGVPNACPDGATKKRTAKKQNKGVK